VLRRGSEVLSESTGDFLAIEVQSGLLPGPATAGVEREAIQLRESGGPMLGVDSRQVVPLLGLAREIVGLDRQRHFETAGVGPTGAGQRDPPAVQSHRLVGARQRQQVSDRNFSRL
jgi:hypothetical protein